ncbi:putative uncharacterized protein [Xanthomonas citri pv. punicae str. LMG 859]|nr:putative uncharacterized protein [Xanthomonas citri pv. punicae str. LMG 859]
MRQDKATVGTVRWRERRPAPGMHNPRQLPSVHCSVCVPLHRLHLFATGRQPL